MRTITILPNGDVEFLGDVPPVDLPLGQIRRRRVSRIVPTNPALRWAFFGLRLAFGERGRIAAWTRTWKCQWRCVILATGQSAVFEYRSEAIEWELETLNSAKFDF